MRGIIASLVLSFLLLSPVSAAEQSANEVPQGIAADQQAATENIKAAREKVKAAEENVSEAEKLLEERKQIKKKLDEQCYKQVDPAITNKSWWDGFFGGALIVVVLSLIFF